MAVVQRSSTDIIANGGEVGALMRAHDWTRTPLGPPDAWPQPLRTIVGVMLGGQPLMFVAWGPDLAFLYNDCYIPVLGPKHPAALGRPMREVYPEVWTDLEPLVARALAGESVWRENLPLRLQRNGRLEDCWFSFSCSPVRDEAGAVAGIFGSGTETTRQVLAERQRKTAEAALREREERLRGVLDGMAEGFGLLAPDFTILEHNAEARRLDGRSREEIVGRSHWEAYPGSEHSELGRLLKQAMAERKPVSLEHCYAWENGRTRWLDMRAYPTPGGALAVFWRDVSDRKMAEERLRAERDRNAEILESISDAFYAIDADRRFTYVNHQAEAWWARSRAELLGKVWCEEFPQAIGSEAYKAHLRAAETREVVRLEAVSPVLGHWIDISIYPTADGGLSVYFRDITEKKRAEEALREMNETLESRVAERTAELLQAQEALRQSQKLEAMGQLTGGVAHDFNNLLTPIVGGLDMLQRRSLGGEREQRLIAGAMQSAERAKTLVQRLLAFARRQPLQETAVDVGKLVTGMADLIGSTSGPQIKVVVEARPDLPPAKADLNQLEMALLNLSVNARDAMPDGGTLRITASEERVAPRHATNLRPGRYVRLSVADTGVGMDKATLARAVEPFFSTKGIGKGTGLGLSMVHGLALQLRGALTIQSRRGVGTNVELWLPVSEAPAEAAGTMAEEAANITGAGTALLVDDEDLVRISIAEMLSELGYTVVEAASGEDALRLIREGLRPDLLVTDHLMPGMSGTDLARIIRAERSSMQILLVSGYAEREGVAPELPRLAKPFRKSELAASLAQITTSA